MIDYLFGGLELLLHGKEFVQTKKKAKSELISALRSALRATNKHISETATDEFTDIASFDLAAKWAKAAELIRPFNANIAQRFEDKSDYWTDPRGFRMEISDHKRKFDFRIRLVEVEKLIHKIEVNWKNIKTKNV